MSDRFEYLGFEKWRPQPALDRETGKRVLMPQHRARFLETASIRGMAERVRELEDPRCATIVCTDPFAVVAPPEGKPTGTLEEWAHAALDCVDVVIRLRREGIVVRPAFDWGWAERHEGKLRPVVIAPAHAATFGPRRLGFSYSWISDVQSWLEQHVSAGPFDLAARRLKKKLKAKDENHARAVDAFFDALRPHLGGRDTSALEQAARTSTLAPPPLDFDLAIELGEAEHAAMVAQQRQQWDTPYVCWPLAGAYHHRGCVAWEAGDRERAVRDVDRALELDPHPRYFTTRALFAEALGDAEAAGFHDAAMLALADPSTEREWGVDPPEIRQRDECRCALSRAAFRHRHGDVAGALQDLRFVKSRWASLEGQLGASVEAFLAHLAP